MAKNKMRLLPVTVEETMEATEEGQQTPYGVEMIEAPQVWKDTDRGEGVVIAVLDTGCDLDHPDLKGQVIDGRNFTDDYNGASDKYDDNHYHGTHVAGTMAALDNDVGVVGVAPKVKLLVLKVLDQNGEGDYENITDAINYAVDWQGDNGEKVTAISLSLGGPDDETALHDAVKKAVDHDILMVCAAGNEGEEGKEGEEISYPGYYKEVMEIGAVDADKKLADFSSTNKRVNLVAPGVKVLSTYPDGKYAKLSGTSMATPHVSAASALLNNELKQQLDRAPSERELYSELNKQTESLGYKKIEEGHGLLALSEQNEEQQTAYKMDVRPIADGYTIALGFEQDEKDAEALAHRIQKDLMKARRKTEIRTTTLTE